MKRRLWYFVAAVLALAAGCTDGLSSGDRVLVAKFLYETKLQDPHRFDVVVFKYPRGPLERSVPKNYIKRLLGLPGEILAIFFGRLFHMPAPVDGAPPYFDDINNPEIDPSDLWQHPRSDDEQARDWFGEGKFSIVRKTPDVMLAMRRIVYDNDFPAKDLEKLGESWKRWKPAAGSTWKDDAPHGFATAGVAKDKVEWLRYHNVLRSPDGEPVAGHKVKPQLITDFLDYNSGSHSQSRYNWVGDLLLECKLDVAKAEGEFLMELSKGVNRFQARWDLATGKCTLVELRDGEKEKVLAERDTRVKTPGSYQLRFANIDARLVVWVDRDLPFGDGVDYPPPEVPTPEERKSLADKKLDAGALQEKLLARRGPRENDLEPASIGSKGAAVQVHNLRLWRDTYYTINENPHNLSDAVKGGGSPWERANLDDPSTWDNARNLNFRTLYVQPGHYLCLGDNSRASSDSRDWGLVPQRLMLGRALLVYFPFQRAGAIR